MKLFPCDHCFDLKKKGGGSNFMWCNLDLNIGHIEQIVIYQNHKIIYLSSKENGELHLK